LPATSAQGISVNSDFFALLWNPDSPSSCESATHVRAALAHSCERMAVVLRLNGFDFYVSDQRTATHLTQLLPDGAGLTYGTLFDRRAADTADEAPFPRAEFNKNACAKIIASGGRYLTENYWGHYVAFLIDSPAGEKRIFRSPTCHQPCLCTTYRGVHLYFSAAEDCAKLGLIRFTINWAFVAAFAASTRISCTETGLNEMTEVATGECHTVIRETVRRAFYWNPANIALYPLVEDLPEAKRALRATVHACVSTWASEHPRIVQRLSGGLDSSIATVCLASAPCRPTVTCVNYYSRGAFGDEREYARAVAERTAFPLMEYRHESLAPLDLLLNFARTESPSSYMSRGSFDRREIELAHDLGATARFTGIMGDMLFQMPPAAPSVAEYVRRHGLDGHFLLLALHAAQMDRVSLWTILRNAFTNGLLTKPSQFQPGEFSQRENSLLTVEADRAVFCDGPLRFVHPWLNNLQGIPFGKFAQIASLSFNSEYYNCLHNINESELIHPFVSEPLIELCLRLPTYLLLRDGWDRALVREAFQAELPPIVTSRAVKGSTIHHFSTQIQSNRQFIQDLMVDGVLVRERILDRKKVIDCLPGKANRSSLPLGLLMASIAAEAWSRAWTERRVRATVV
jgi:asparagine synthase (glutamine-hydrolysing)